MEIANGHAYYTAPKHIELLKKSLSIIPIFLAQKDDCVLIDGNYPHKFIAQLSAYNWHIPHIISSENMNDLQGRSFASFEPWGWSPAVIKKIENLQRAYKFTITRLYAWNDDSKNMFSRFSGYELCKILKHNIIHSKYMAIPQLPIIVKNLDDLRRIESEMKHPMLLKTPWSASGKGLFTIRNAHEKSYENLWVIAKLNEQKSMFAEPLLRKVQDVSFHFLKTKKAIEFLGLNFFKTESDGKFKGCYINFYNQKHALTEIALPHAIDEATQAIYVALRSMRSIETYEGYIGVDALFFRNEHDEIKLHPAIEINLRKTMGLLNLHIEPRIAPNLQGMWEIMPTAEFAALQSNASAPQAMQLASGVFPLSPSDMGGSVVMALSLHSS